MEFVFKPFVLNTYEDVKPYLDDLVNREVKTKEETEQWIRDYDNLNAQIGENYNRRQVKHTCDTTNEEIKNSYMYFITDISPKLAQVDDVLNKKIVQLPGIEELAKEDEGYEIWLRGVKKSLEMFREENIPLKTEETEKERLFGEIAGAMSIEHDGKKLTLQQAAKYLESPDREVRKAVYEKVQLRRAQDKEKLNNLLDELMWLRVKIAKNAGYESFVEYQWDHYGRFDYTQQDVFDFHEGVKQYVVPLMGKIFEEKRQRLGVEVLKPYDTSANYADEQPLKPFETGEELLEKSIKAMERLHGPFGENLRIMQQHDRFDLVSRPGKAPGGYNCGMPVTRYPFIFMNAAGTQNDMHTLMHEAGHGMHSFASADLMRVFNNYTMEIAEVASMSMEFMSMYFWDEFYKNPEDLRRAQQQQIEDALSTLPRISIIDSFQYRLYKNPGHTVEEREAKFGELLDTYHPRVNREGFEEYKKILWQKQLHIYEVPFYYIEYGIAQLGAFGVWKNYMANPEKALADYKAALSLGYTKKLPKLYETAGIPFDFSPARIKELAEFVWGEREKIKG